MTIAVETDVRHLLLSHMQRARAARGMPAFDVVPDNRGGQVLAVRGELLVRRGDLRSPAVARFVSGWGLTAEPVPGLHGRVVRLTGRALLAGLPAILREVRARRLPVTAHHLTPMAGYIKALAGPVPAAAAEPFHHVRPAGRTVAVLDTGVDARSRTDGWLAGLATADNTDPLIDSVLDGVLDVGAGHGTFVAGIVQRTAPSAVLRAYRTLDSDGVGSDARVGATVVRAAEDGADVVNLSLGTRTVDDEAPIALEAALELLAERHPDVLVVAAAGNDGDERPCWPAAFPDVVSVAGLTASSGPAEWSTHGDWVTCSTVAEDVVSTFVEGRRPGVFGERTTVFGADPWASWTGTSFATPQVAAAVAERSADRGVTPRQALAELLADRPELPGYGVVLAS
jgi:hypothetical protein